MLYEFTFRDYWNGHLVAEIDMRAEITGDPSDWTADTIEFWSLDGGPRERWVELPRQHPRHAEVVAHLISTKHCGLIDNLYIDHIVNVEGRQIPYIPDGHRLTVREVV